MAQLEVDAERAAALRDALREPLAVAARIVGAEDGAGDVVAEVREDGLALDHAGGVEQLQVLAVVAQQRRLLEARLELGLVGVEVEHACGLGGVVDALGLGDRLDQAVAVPAQPVLDERVALRTVGSALAQEPDAPADQRRIEPRLDADRRLLTRQRAEHQPRRGGRGPGVGVARRDQPGVAGARILADLALAVDDDHLVPIPGEVVGARDADDARSEHDDLHAEFLPGSDCRGRGTDVRPGRASFPHRPCAGFRYRAG